MIKYQPMEMIKNEPQKEILNLDKPIFIGVSGPSGAGKDYLIDASGKRFTEMDINVTVVQMTTERPDRGPGVETKLCISSDQYDLLEKNDEFIGSHKNGEYRYGYKKADLQNAMDTCKNGGIIFIELNPFAQPNFPSEIKEKLGANLIAWIGVKNTIEQTEISMRERGESEDSIKERIAKVKKYYDAMEENPFISYVNNGPDNRAGSTSDFVKIIKDKITENK